MMPLLKFTAPRVHDGRRFLPGGRVVITNEQGRIADIIPREEAGDDIRELEGILAPGLINCHLHLELSHMKGKIPPGTGLVDFVLQVINQRESPGEEVLHAIAGAEAEMLRNGIVAAGDICNRPDTLSRKLKKNLAYHNFIEISGYPPAIASARFARGVEMQQAFSASGSSSIVPHAPYSVSGALLDLILGHPGNELLTMHNQESAGENEWFHSGSGEMQKLYDTLNIDSSAHSAAGLSSLRTVAGMFRKSQQLILVHNVHSSREDVLAVQSRIDNLYWCLCPLANLYIGGMLPDVGMLMAEGARIVLGTDSLASNEQLDLVKEMQTLKKHFSFVEDEALIEWATANGAAALKMEERLGSLRKATSPGLVAIDDGFNRVARLV